MNSDRRFEAYRRAVASLACLAALASLSTSAFAHAGNISAEGNSFGTGFLHPIMGTDHLLAMVAVGIWGTQMRGAAIWALPVAFPMMMAVGAVLGIAGVPFPAVELGIAGSIIVLGSAIAFAIRPPILVALLVVGVLALFHGHAHGSELPHNANPTGFTLGFVVGTGLLHAAGIVLALLLERLPRGADLVRALGAIFAAAGVYILVR